MSFPEINARDVEEYIREERDFVITLDEVEHAGNHYNVVLSHEGGGNTDVVEIELLDDDGVVCKWVVDDDHCFKTILKRIKPALNAYRNKVGV